ncbi:hypothetical protein M877_03390 [Streptomyces niveus NCIMB 11891]|nr:hypothetical protein M877_03390 [Streptomyces niveus NCIMB 11891]
MARTFLFLLLFFLVFLRLFFGRFLFFLLFRLFLILVSFERRFQQRLCPLLECVGDSFEATVGCRRQRRSPGGQYVTAGLFHQRRHRRVIRQLASGHDDQLFWIHWELLSRHESGEAKGKLPLLGPAKDVARRHGGGHTDFLAVLHGCLAMLGEWVTCLFGRWEPTASRRYRTRSLRR